jgi:hypothetical protein
VFAFVLVESGDAPHATKQKKERATDYLDAMRLKFMGKRCQKTQHFWRFMVESQADIRSGAAVWVQRWALPAQLPHQN